jgi:hypothetical protein
MIERTYKVESGGLIRGGGLRFKLLFERRGAFL